MCRCCDCSRPPSWKNSPMPLKMRLSWARSASTRSSICCCVASNGDRQGSTRPHPRDERRQLPPQKQQEEKRSQHAIALQVAYAAACFWRRLPLRPNRAALTGVAWASLQPSPETSNNPLRDATTGTAGVVTFSSAATENFHSALDIWVFCDLLRQI